jgi:hypothetical protein
MVVVFAVAITVFKVASIRAPAVWAFVQINEALAGSVLDC